MKCGLRNRHDRYTELHKSSDNKRLPDAQNVVQTAVESDLQMEKKLQIIDIMVEDVSC